MTPVGGRAAIRPPAGQRGTLRGWIVKIVLLCVVDGLTAAAVPKAISSHQWGMLAGLIVVALAINVVYLHPRLVAAKFLLPGGLFLAVFLLYPIVYTIDISFSNYGTGHVVSKSQAVSAIVGNGLSERQNGPEYKIKVLRSGNQYALLLTDEAGKNYLGTTSGLSAAAPGSVTETDGLITAVRGYQVLNLREAAGTGNALANLQIPTDGGVVKTTSFTRAAVFDRTMRYDSARDQIVDTRSHIVYHDHKGQFVSGGKPLSPGWRTGVGFGNYSDAFTNSDIQGAFLRVLIWTLLFAGLSSAITFMLGLLLAISLGHPSLRGRRIYRSLLIVPYALPSFITALVWRGMLNGDYGVINSILHVKIDWLLDPTLAKVAVLLVNTWMGFPYWFLIASGVLQSISTELPEAARVDGASARQVFSHITLPLLLLATGPLIVLNFAFNFNNFNAIFLVTGGGPPVAGSGSPVGHTDILISYTYDLAFGAGTGNNYGLASAISVIIFAIVLLISVFGIRHTLTRERVA